MSRRHRNLVMVGLAALVLATLAAQLSAGRPLPNRLHNQSPVTVSPSLMPQSPTPSVGRLPTYAISLSRLQGLTPTIAPGVRLELWVTWEPPITRRPRVQKLLANVLLQRIVPGLTPESPATALLEVEEAQVPRLLFGDRFGALSAVVMNDL